MSPSCDSTKAVAEPTFVGKPRARPARAAPTHTYKSYALFLIAACRWEGGSRLPHVENLSSLKTRLEAVLSGNEESLGRYGESRNAHVKAYLLESNVALSDLGPLAGGTWRSIDRVGWYALDAPASPESFFLDASSDRVWRLFSLEGAVESDAIVRSWLEANIGLDRCWLSRNQLMWWKGQENWKERGVGLRFLDGLAPEDEAGTFSLKAWYGASRHIPQLQDVLSRAKESFSIYSVRWQKRSAGDTVLSAEIYSDGKVTINRATDVDEVLNLTSLAADRYEASLKQATKARATSLAPFELHYSQQIDLDAFTDVVTHGRGEMRLWLVETSKEADFRRFRGVDMHTWDRVLIDVGPDYAYMSVPGKGCVNAVPRLATIQGEDNAGRTTIHHDGVELFA